MATFDFTNQQQGLPWDGRNKVLQLRNLVDFSGDNIGGSGMTAGMTSSQTAEIFDIPEGVLLIQASCRVVTTEGGASTGHSLGVLIPPAAISASALIATINAGAAVGVTTLSTLALESFVNTTTLAGGSVVFTAGATIAAAKLEFQAIC